MGEGCVCVLCVWVLNISRLVRSMWFYRLRVTLGILSEGGVFPIDVLLLVLTSQNTSILRRRWPFCVLRLTMLGVLFCV